MDLTNQAESASPNDRQVDQGRTWGICWSCSEVTEVVAGLLVEHERTIIPSRRCAASETAPACDF